MNAQPNPFGEGGFGKPPVATGMSRLMPHLKTAVAGGVVVTIGFMAAQKLLPDGWRPADIAGSAAGSTERHEIEEKQTAKIAYERGLADAQAQANAQAQADLAAANLITAGRADALTAQREIANLADAACFGGLLVGMLGAQTTGKDWHDGAQAVAQATCGQGDALRDNIARKQDDGLQEARAAVRDRPSGTRPNATGVAAPLFPARQ